MLGDMHWIALLAALCSVPVLAADDTVRRGDIPKPYWGTWAPDASGCKEPAQRFFLSGEEYVGPEVSCGVVSVSETPSQTGPNYSARLECSPKGVTNLIIQPKGKDAVLSGHDLQNLKPYQRCSTNAAATTEPGQSPKPPIRPSPPAQAQTQKPDQTLAARIAEWFKTCMADWDRATHMTKAEWRSTCRRVADERGRFVAEQSRDTLPKTDKKPGQR
jgi:hypothetical protein